MSSTQSKRQVALAAAKASLERIQKFDAESIARENELGAKLSLKDAVPSVQRLVDLYRQLPVESIDWFNLTWIDHVKSSADADFNLINKAQVFDPEKGDAGSTRASLINQLEAIYDEAFQRLNEKIAYASSRVTDFTQISREARSMIQDIEDRARQLAEKMDRHGKDAEKILVDIRRVAEEQGVSQQAHYFKIESEHHRNESVFWLVAASAMTLVLASVAIGSLFLHKWEWLAPATLYEAIQIAVSKVLVFSTIAYYLIFCAKNFRSHHHNLVVNKHRYNALLTYQALVDAAGDDHNRDIVLSKAADCIYAPQPTGFSKSESGESGSISMVSVSPGAFKSSAGTGT